jgi:spermidine/putrescine-binding protein
MMRLFTRTALVAMGAVGAMSVLSAIDTDSAAWAGDRFKGQVLKVGTWGGKWGGFQKEIIVPKIEAEGGEVQFVHASTQDNIAKLAAARGRDVPIDVMEILDAIMPTFTKENLLQKIDLS